MVTSTTTSDKWTHASPLCCLSYHGSMRRGIKRPAFLWYDARKAEEGMQGNEEPRTGTEKAEGKTCLIRTKRGRTPRASGKTGTQYRRISLLTAIAAC